MPRSTTGTLNGTTETLNNTDLKNHIDTRYTAMVAQEHSNNNTTTLQRRYK